MAYAHDAWIPWLPADPQLCHGENAGEVKYMWYPPKELPFPDPNNERVLNKGTDDFVKTTRVLKKITWYVPDGVEFKGGLPRVPVKIYGEVPPKQPPPPKPKLEAVADPADEHLVGVDGHDGHIAVQAGAVDLRGVRDTDHAKQLVRTERKALLQRYQEA